jgi:NADH dehydrogenase
MMASIGRHDAVGEVVGLRVSGFLAWILWRAVYLSKMPTLVHKLEVAMDWVHSILFPPNVVQLQLSRTSKLPRVQGVNPGGSTI